MPKKKKSARRAPPDKRVVIPPWRTCLKIGQRFYAHARGWKIWPNLDPDESDE